MLNAADRFRLGIAIVDTPNDAVATASSLVEAGLHIEQICLIAVDQVMRLCEAVATSVADGSARVSAIFGSTHRPPGPVEGDAIAATSDRLFNLFLRTQLTPAGSIVRSQASRNSWDVERAIRDGAIAVVALPKDNRQNQVVTRLLLATSTHSVTTYDLAPEQH